MTSCILKLLLTETDDLFPIHNSLSTLVRVSENSLISRFGMFIWCFERISVEISCCKNVIFGLESKYSWAEYSHVGPQAAI